MRPVKIRIGIALFLAAGVVNARGAARGEDDPVSKALAELERQSARGGDRDSRRAAIRRLAALEDARVTRKLASVAESDDDDRARSLAAEGLAARAGRDAAASASLARVVAKNERRTRKVKVEGRTEETFYCGRCPDGGTVREVAGESPLCGTCGGPVKRKVKKEPDRTVSVEEGADPVLVALEGLERNKDSAVLESVARGLGKEWDRLAGAKEPRDERVAARAIQTLGTSKCTKSVEVLLDAWGDVERRIPDDRRGPWLDRIRGSLASLTGHAESDREIWRAWWDANRETALPE